MDFSSLVSAVKAGDKDKIVASCKKGTPHTEEGLFSISEFKRFVPELCIGELSFTLTDIAAVCGQIDVLKHFTEHLEEVVSIHAFLVAVVRGHTDVTEHILQTQGHNIFFERAEDTINGLSAIHCAAMSRSVAMVRLMTTSEMYSRSWNENYNHHIPDRFPAIRCPLQLSMRVADLVNSDSTACNDSDFQVDVDIAREFLSSRVFNKYMVFDPFSVAYQPPHVIHAAASIKNPQVSFHFVRVILETFLDFMKTYHPPRLAERLKVLQAFLKDETGRSPLMNAVEQGNIRSLKEISVMLGVELPSLITPTDLSGYYGTSEFTDGTDGDVDALTLRHTIVLKMLRVEDERGHTVLDSAMKVSDGGAALEEVLRLVADTYETTGTDASSFGVYLDVAMPTRVRLLHDAAELGDTQKLKVVKMFLKDSDRMQVNDKGENYLHVAAKHSRVQVVEEGDDTESSFNLLTSHSSIYSGDTVLHTAFRTGSRDTMLAALKLLRAKDLALHQLKDSEGNHVGHILAGVPNFPQPKHMFEELLSSGFEPEYLSSSNRYGDTPFHVAAKARLSQTLLDLMEVKLHGRNVWPGIYQRPYRTAADNSKEIHPLYTWNDDGLTPIHLAVEEGLDHVVCAAVETGFDYRDESRDGNNILHFLIRKSTETEDDSGSVKLLELLLNVVKARVRANNGVTSVEENGAEEEKNRFLSLVCADRPADHEDQPLLYAYEKRKPNVIRLILDAMEAVGLSHTDDHIEPTDSRVTFLAVKRRVLMKILSDADSQMDGLLKVKAMKSLLDKTFSIKAVVINLCQGVVHISIMLCLSVFSVQFYDKSPCTDRPVLEGLLSSESGNTSVLDNSTIPVNNSTAPVNNSTILLNNSTIPVNASSSSCELVFSSHVHLYFLVWPLILLVHSLFTIGANLSHIFSKDTVVKDESRKFWHNLRYNTAAILEMYSNILAGLPFGTLALCLIVVSLTEYSEEVEKTLLVFTILFGWIYTLEYTRALRSLYVFRLMLYRTLGRDIFPFAIVSSVICLAYSFAFIAFTRVQVTSNDHQRQNGNVTNESGRLPSSLLSVMFLVVQWSLGLSDPDFSAYTDGQRNLLRVLYVSLIGISFIVLLNMIIALMNVTHAELNAQEEVLWLKSMAQQLHSSWRTLSTMAKVARMLVNICRRCYEVFGQCLTVISRCCRRKGKKKGVQYLEASHRPSSLSRVSSDSDSPRLMAFRYPMASRPKMASRHAMDSSCAMTSRPRHAMASRPRHAMASRHVMVSSHAMDSRHLMDLRHAMGTSHAMASSHAMDSQTRMVSDSPEAHHFKKKKLNLQKVTGHSIGSIPYHSIPLAYQNAVSDTGSLEDGLPRTNRSLSNRSLSNRSTASYNNINHLRRSPEEYIPLLPPTQTSSGQRIGPTLDLSREEHTPLSPPTQLSPSEGSILEYSSAECRPTPLSPPAQTHSDELVGPTLGLSLEEHTSLTPPTQTSSGQSASPTLGLSPTEHTPFTPPTRTRSAEHIGPTLGLSLEERTPLTPPSRTRSDGHIGPSAPISVVRELPQAKMAEVADEYAEYTEVVHVDDYVGMDDGVSAQQLDYYRPQAKMAEVADEYAEVHSHVDEYVEMEYDCSSARERDDCQSVCLGSLDSSHSIVNSIGDTDRWISDTGVVRRMSPPSASSIRLKSSRSAVHGPRGGQASGAYMRKRRNLPGLCQEL